MTLVDLKFDYLCQKKEEEEEEEEEERRRRKNEWEDSKQRPGGRWAGRNESKVLE